MATDEDEDIEWLTGIVAAKAKKNAEQEQVANVDGGGRSSSQGVPAAEQRRKRGDKNLRSRKKKGS